VQGSLTRIVDGGCVGTAKKKDADYRGMVAICCFVKRSLLQAITGSKKHYARNIC
jgi:hypothetical protein